MDNLATELVKKQAEKLVNIMGKSRKPNSTQPHTTRTHTIFYGTLRWERTDNLSWCAWHWQRLRYIYGSNIQVFGVDSGGHVGKTRVLGGFGLVQGGVRDGVSLVGDVSQSSA